MFPRRARIKRVLSSWDSSFLYLFVWRKSESGDRFEIWERQSGDRCESFSAFSQFTDNLPLHRRFHLSRRDIPVSRNSFIWILRTAPANFICPCYSFVHMVGENESQNEKMENETISFSIFHFQLLTDPQPESQTHPFHPDASDNALSLPRSRRRAAAQRSGSGWP